MKYEFLRAIQVFIANSLYFKNYDEFNWVITVYKGNTSLIVLILLYLYYS
ncbi:uncharacterised protein [Saccharolobus solfataricus]|uniref:Uncharacterized protein n=2 Tax=Saccharolobus solfataricus TaxID=2287 RepID=A0A157T4K8_SACSO|nr:uncharacterised protein [Saccharolobus solfataricus]